MIRVYLKKKPDCKGIYYLFDKIIQVVSFLKRGGSKIYIHAEMEFSDGRFFSSRGDGPDWAKSNEIEILPGEWDIIPIPYLSKELEKLMVHQADIIKSGAFTTQKVRYGWTKILTSFLPIPLMVQRPTELICSETVTILLQCVGPLVGYSAEGIDPTLLARLLRMELPGWQAYQKR